MSPCDITTSRVYPPCVTPLCDGVSCGVRAASVEARTVVSSQALTGVQVETLRTFTPTDALVSALTRRGGERRQAAGGTGRHAV